MKNLYYCILIFFMAACSDNSNTSNPPSTAKEAENTGGETKTVTGPDSITAANTGGQPTVTTSTGETAGDITPGAGTTLLTDDGQESIVFVGVFARWNKGNGIKFDGTYDTTHNLFVLCSSNNCQKVARNEIIFQQFANCDTAQGDRIKLFRIKKNGTINTEGTRIKVEGTKGIIQVGAATHFIQLDQPTIKRINRGSIFNGPATLMEVPANKTIKEEAGQIKVNNHATLPADIKMQPNAAIKSQAETPAVKMQNTVNKIEAKPAADSKVKMMQPKKGG